MDDVIVNKEDGIDVGYRSSYGIRGALGSLGQIEAIDLLPPLVGGTVSLGTTILARKFGGANLNLVTYAPLLGAGAGVLASIPLFWWRGKKAVISGAVTSVLIGGGLFAFEKISASTWMISGMYDVSRQRMRGYHEIDGGYGGYALPTAQVPGGVASAMDVSAFGANVT